MALLRLLHGRFHGPGLAQVPPDGRCSGRPRALLFQSPFSFSCKLQLDRHLLRDGRFRRWNSSVCPIDRLGLPGAGFLSPRRGVPSWPHPPNPSRARISRLRSNELRPILLLILLSSPGWFLAYNAARRLPRRWFLTAAPFRVR